GVVPVGGTGAEPGVVGAGVVGAGVVGAGVVGAGAVGPGGVAVEVSPGGAGDVVLNEDVAIESTSGSRAGSPHACSATHALHAQVTAFDDRRLTEARRAMDCSHVKRARGPYLVKRAWQNAIALTRYAATAC